jgi:hypothetical protein
MSQLAIDFAAAAQRRDTGIKRAADHADRDLPGWGEAALDYLRKYATEHASFLAEEVRWAGEGSGSIPPPPDGRAWGAVMQCARRAGVIRKDGYREAKDSNLSVKVLWRSLVIASTAQAAA